jgi:hypothetical protein
MAHRWWQRLGRNCLRVMEAATETKRSGKEQTGDNESTYMHDEIPVFDPKPADRLETDQCNVVAALTVPS